MNSETAFKMGKILFFPNCKVELTDVNPGSKPAALDLCHLAEDMGTSGSSGFLYSPTKVGLGQA